MFVLLFVTSRVIDNSYRSTAVSRPAVFLMVGKAIILLVLAQDFGNRFPL